MGSGRASGGRRSRRPQYLSGTSFTSRTATHQEAKKSGKKTGDEKTNSQVSLLRLFFLKEGVLLVCYLIYMYIFFLFTFLFLTFLSLLPPTFSSLFSLVFLAPFVEMNSSFLSDSKNLVQNSNFPLCIKKFEYVSCSSVCHSSPFSISSQRSILSSSRIH